MGKDKQTTVNKSDPYSGLSGYFKDASSTLTNYLNDPKSNEVYGGQRTVGPSANTQSGLAGLANNAGYGQARDHMSKTLNGDFLKADNPYLQQLQQSVQSSVMPGLNATFAKSGMANSTLHQGAVSRGLTDGMANPLFQNYQNERQMQDRAASMLPQLDQANAENQIRAGQLGEGYERERIQSEQQKWQEEQDAPLRALQKTYGMASDMGSRYGTQTSTNTTQQSPWKTAAGVGLMGLSAMSGMGGMGGMGAIGGGGGGFMGMLSGAGQYGWNNWNNAGGQNFNNRGGYATSSQRS
jgi:hypothetical protein